MGKHERRPDAGTLFGDRREFAREQAGLNQRVRQFREAGDVGCTRHPHPFFGKLGAQDWSRGRYKHHDHHLRQFGE